MYNQTYRSVARPVLRPSTVDWESILPSKKLLRVQEVASTLNCSMDHVYHLIAEGALATVVDLRSRSAQRSCPRISRDSVLEFLERNRQ
jgi:excisionase family DNA binding protein